MNHKFSRFLLVFFVVFISFILYISPEIIRQNFMDIGGFIGFPTYYHFRIAKIIEKYGDLDYYDPLSFQGRPGTYPPGLHIILTVISLSSFSQPSKIVVVTPPLLGSLSILFIYVMTRRLGFKYPLSTAILFAFLPTHLYNSCHLSSRILPFFLSLGCITSVLLKKGLNSNSEIKPSFLTILLISTVFLTHPIGLIFSLILLIPVFKFRNIYRLIALYISGGFLSLPWHIHVYYTAGLIKKNILHNMFSELKPNIMGYFFETSNLIYLSVSFLVYFFAFIYLKKAITSVKQRLAVEWLFLSLILTLIFGIRANIYLSLALSILAITPLMRKKRVKYLFFAIIILEFFISLKFLINVYPHPASIDALKWLRNNSPDDAVVLSDWSRGHWISAIAGRKNIIDIYAEYAPQPEQRWFDSRIIFSARNRTWIYTILNKYNISYIYIDRDLVYQIPTINNTFLPLMYKNNKLFQKVYDDSKGTVIFSYKRNNIDINYTIPEYKPVKLPKIYYLNIIPLFSGLSSIKILPTLFSLLSRLRISEKLTLPSDWAGIENFNYAYLISEHKTLIPYDIKSQGGRFIVDYPAFPLISAIISTLAMTSVSKSIIYASVIFSFVASVIIMIISRKITMLYYITPLLFSSIYLTNYITSGALKTLPAITISSILLYLIYFKTKNIQSTEIKQKNYSHGLSLTIILIIAAIPLFQLNATIFILFTLSLTYLIYIRIFRICIYFILAGFLYSMSYHYLVFLVAAIYFNLKKIKENPSRALAAICIYIFLNTALRYGLGIYTPLVTWLSTAFIFSFFYKDRDIIIGGILSAMYYSNSAVLFILIMIFYWLIFEKNEIKKYVGVMLASFLLYMLVIRYKGISPLEQSWGFLIPIWNLPRWFGGLLFYSTIFGIVLSNNFRLLAILTSPLILSQIDIRYYTANNFIPYLLISLPIFMTISLEKFFNVFKNIPEKEFSYRLKVYTAIFLIYWLPFAAIYTIEDFTGYINERAMTLVAWIYDNTDPDSLFIADIDTAGIVVPQILNRTSWIDGNWFAAPQLSKKMRIAKKFFTFNCKFVNDIFNKYKIDYSLITYRTAIYHRTDLYSSKLLLEKCSRISFYDTNSSYGMIIEPFKKQDLYNFYINRYNFTKSATAILLNTSIILRKYNIGRNNIINTHQTGVDRTFELNMINSTKNNAKILNNYGKFLYATAPNELYNISQSVWDITLGMEFLADNLQRYMNKKSLRNIKRLNITNRKLWENIANSSIADRKFPLCKNKNIYKSLISLGNKTCLKGQLNKTIDNILSNTNEILLLYSSINADNYNKSRQKLLNKINITQNLLQTTYIIAKKIEIRLPENKCNKSNEIFELQDNAIRLSAVLQILKENPWLYKNRDNDRIYIWIEDILRDITDNLSHNKLNSRSYTK